MLLVLFSTSWSVCLETAGTNQIVVLGFSFFCSKCHLFQTLSEVKYLGHVVSTEGVTIDPDKVAAVRDWRTPSNLVELRSFLGFASYYRRFIAGFAQMAAPLH